MPEPFVEQTHQGDSAARRVTFLDGLRGLAALQVVLLHYCAAFLPGLGTQNAALIHYGWESAWLRAPLFFILDGTFAVYVFFAISGMVLTLAYARPSFCPVHAIGQRIVRLGLPMAAALAFGAVLLRLVPGAHHQAADLSGSMAWLGSLYRAPYTIAEILRQATTSGMFLGYQEASILPKTVLDALVSDSTTRSLDPPLWTLHYELWGSLLVVLLAVVHRRLPLRFHIGFVFTVGIVLSRHPLLPFLIGHLFALAWQGMGWPSKTSSRWRAVAVVALVAGMWSCTNPAWPWVTWLSSISDWHASPGDAHLQAMYGALLAFTGIMFLSPLHRMLASPVPRWLGRISFGLYLTHFPIVFTAASATFVALRGPLHYGGAALAAFGVGLPLSLLTAEAFTRFVDRPAVRLSRILARFSRHFLLADSTF